MQEDIVQHTYNEDVIRGEKMLLSLTSTVNKVADRHIHALEEEVEDLKAQMRKRDEMFGSQMMEWLEENRALKEENKALKKHATATAQPTCLLALDTRLFKGSTMAWQQNLWDALLEFATEKDNNDDYWLKNAACLAPIHMILSSTKCSYPFKGSYADFEYLWNTNVANRINDETRREKMTCKAKTLTATLNKPQWKDTAVTSWRVKRIGGDKYADYYDIACGILDRMKPVIEKKL